MLAEAGASIEIIAIKVLAHKSPLFFMRPPGTPR
jgi:hypothetical protein